MLLVVGYGYCQSPQSKLIDSLNLTENLERRIELSQQIALQFMGTDWERAITYLELAENEAKKSNDPEAFLAPIYITAAKMYSSKDVLDVTLDYYQKAYAIYKKQGNHTEMAKMENNLAIIYAQGNDKDRAMEYFMHVYAYQAKKNDSVQLVKILNNRGPFI